MLLHVDAWDPGYGTGLETGAAPGGTDERPDARSTAQLSPDVELPVAAWRALVAPGDVRSPAIVLMVDGVRRIDAHVWITGDDGVTHAGLAASYAAGVVRCDLRRGVAEVAAARIARGLFTPSPAAREVVAGAARYPVAAVKSDRPVDLIIGVQRRLQALEVQVAAAARGGPAARGDAAARGGPAARGDAAARGGPAARGDGSTPAVEAEAPIDDLLVIDGPLHGRDDLARALGYVKSHRVEYLPPELSTVVASLRPGQRCPVFQIGTNWHRYAWYLRLPGPGGSPWAGIVRAECSAELPVGAAIGLADLSTVTLPRFASTAYKDPRAPQNLVPIAGLERRLRAMLGDARFLHRALTLAANSTSSGTVPATTAAASGGAHHAAGQARP